ncbi:MAG TPA: OsmC family protein [Gammaproteobacteria bacterium]
MSSYQATVSWKLRPGESFGERRYSRDHIWTFDGGLEIAASASPHVVPPPLSSPEHVDPEEAFIAAIASCHMLWFLHLIAIKGFKVASYTDTAVGNMGRNEQKRMAITAVTLRPAIVFDGPQPDASMLAGLHAEAHEKCFIANSVTSKITIQPLQPLE